MILFKEINTNKIIEFSNESSIGSIFFVNSLYVKLSEDEVKNYLLQKAKDEKIAEIKRINDEKNIEPSTAQAHIIKENGTLGDVVSFKFKTTRHPSNPASDPNTILFNTIAFKKTTRYSTTNQETGEQIAIQLTPQIAESIGSHLAVRNTNNFQNRDELLAKIKEAKTIEEVEAISWVSK
jgi:hypothetical protein